MIIQWEGGENFQIKTKHTTVKVGEKNSLGELVLPGPGEYEVGGAQMEIIDGVTRVFAEAMSLAHIKKGKVFSDEELEKLNGVDILLIGVSGGKFTDTKVALEVIAQIEPAIVIPMGENLDEFKKEESVSSESKDELKVTKNELPIEERQVVVLNARK